VNEESKIFSDNVDNLRQHMKRLNVETRGRSIGPYGWLRLYLVIGLQGKGEGDSSLALRMTRRGVATGE
jgi:hypothetical protein